MQLVLLILSIINLFGLLIYYLIFSRVKNYASDSKINSSLPPVSLIICAKNEEKNLEKHLPYWLQQDYPNFEVVIVNDQSTDNSLSILKNAAAANPHLQIVNRKVNDENKWLGKRNALWAGVQQAKHNHLVFTDADCRPLSKHWLQQMANGFKHNTEVVLGYSPFFPKPTFVFQLVQFETVLTAMQYFGWANLGHPYMGVGRNSAYKKELLTEEIISKSNLSLSGDDDLIIQQIANANNTAAVVNEDAFTVSEPPVTLKEWFYQKVRHAGSGKYYQSSDKWRLGIFTLLNVGLYILVYLGILLEYNFLYIGLLLIKALLFKFVCLPTLKLLKARMLQGSFILIDFLFWHALLIIFIFSIFNTTNVWTQQKNG